ncbi:MAG: hypothetical protein EAZ55_04390 [Cytophagales bacterium]|nr:MAG: hypothetical protein EAZ55_04390 [Cytophagales bacterium]
MKQLSLVRHAHSLSTQNGQTDYERILSPIGLEEIETMSTWLGSQKTIDCLIASAAVRTTQTADFFAKILNYPKENIIFERKIYQATLESLLSFIQQIDKKYDSVLLIGHNPTITHLAEYLTGFGLRDMPTCSIVTMNFETNEWADIDKNQGNLITFKHPQST